MFPKAVFIKITIHQETFLFILMMATILWPYANAHSKASIASANIILFSNYYISLVNLPIYSIT